MDVIGGNTRPILWKGKQAGATVRGTHHKRSGSRTVAGHEKKTNRGPQRKASVKGRRKRLTFEGFPTEGKEKADF